MDPVIPIKHWRKGSQVDDILDIKLDRKYQLVTDKGTLDAIGLHPDGTIRRIMYWDSISILVAPGGLVAGYVMNHQRLRRVHVLAFSSSIVPIGDAHSKDWVVVEPETKITQLTKNWTMLFWLPWTVGRGKSFVALDEAHKKSVILKDC